MNKKFLFSLFAVLGLLLPVLSVVAGVCGVGEDCQFCATQELCEAKENCAWVSEACEFAGIVPVSLGNISGILTYLGSIWTDFKLLIAVVVGLPFAFWVVRKAMGLVRA